MEQVFQTVNDLLDRDKRARDRHLHFRTYVVIPLAENNGLIEFVGDTQSIGDWLLPAHKK
jgi:ataxia telangiectasia mutated family protein